MKNTHNPGYFRITHLPSGKFFFGACTDLKSGIYLLRYKLEHKIHSNIPLRDAFTNWADCKVEQHKTDSRLKAQRKRAELVKRHSEDPLCCNGVIGGNHAQRFRTTAAVVEARKRGNTSEHNANIAKARTGTKLKAETIAKLKIAASSRKNRKIKIEGVIYDSIKEGANAVGLPYNTTRSRAVSNRWPEWMLL